jgi:hypothetical protein
MVKAKLFEVQTQRSTLSTVNTKMVLKEIVGNFVRYRALMSIKFF